MDSKTIDKPINEKSYTEYFDLYKKSIISQSFLISILILLYSALCNSFDAIYYWMMTISLIVMSLYSIMFGVYIHKLLNTCENSYASLSSSCYKFAIQNYKLLREYKEFIDYNNVKSNEIISYQDIKECVLRIFKYLKLTYQLSLIKTDDTIELRQDTLYINISTEPITNKRNRKIESILNSIPNEYKSELFNTWSIINKDKSLHLIMMTPCKWIIYEYRNLFRHFYKSDLTKDIYTKFNTEYAQIENMVYKLCNKIYSINSISNDVNIPKTFITVFNLVTDLLIFLVNNFVAICILICFNTTNKILFTLLMIIFTHFIVMTLINMVNNLCSQLSFNNNISNINNDKIDNIFDEMHSLMIIGKHQFY